MRDGWVEKTLGDVVKLGKGGSWGQDSPAEFLSEVICLRGTDLADLIEKKIPIAPTRWVKESELKKSRCQPNMVVIETSGSKCGRSIVLTEEILGLFPLPVIYSNFCRTLEIATEIVSNHYIELWFSHNYQNGLIPSYRATSAMPNLDVKALLRVESVPIPPLPEQKRIVDLISSVDSYIEALRQQLEKANRSRSAVLHELLTAGGDGWAETTLGDLAAWSSGKNISKDSRILDGEFPIVGANGEIGRTNEFLYDQPLVVVGRVGSCGETYLITEKVWISDNALIALPNAKIVTNYLYHLLKTFDYSKIISGTTQPLITQGKLKTQSVLLPPLAEQKRVVDLISTADSYIDALKEQINSSTSLRSGLLSDLLSGNQEIPASYDQLIGAA